MIVPNRINIDRARSIYKNTSLISGYFHKVEHTHGQDPCGRQYSRSVGYRYAGAKRESPFQRLEGTGGKAKGRFRLPFVFAGWSEW